MHVTRMHTVSVTHAWNRMHALKGVVDMSATRGGGEDVHTKSRIPLF